MFKSFMYHHPLIYETGIRFLYWGGLKKLSSMIGECQTVFEPACGYGRIKKFLPENCVYSGIDLNKAFIRYGQQKGLDVRLADIFDADAYPESDLILLCDILHHLSDEKIRRLLDISLRKGRAKLVIVEPAFVSVASSGNFFSRWLGRIFALADADGINEIENWLSEEEYQKLFDYIRTSPRVRDLSIVKHRFHYFVEVFLQ